MGEVVVFLSIKNRSLSLNGCEKIAGKRARQAKAPAPPLRTQHLFWWRRRFRLRILIFSQLLTIAVTT